MSKPANYFWDTCVFTAHLSEQPNGYNPGIIAQLLTDARRGSCKIYTSTIASAEILPGHLVGKSYSSFERFMKDFEGAVITIAPDQNIMSLAARLRDIPYAKKVNNLQTVPRTMDVPDAIMLATAIVMEDGYQVPLNAFHTYDDGGKRSPDGGKRVPILSYQTWCNLLPPKYLKTAERVIKLKRERPNDPGLGLLNV